MLIGQISVAICKLIPALWWPGKFWSILDLFKAWNSRTRKIPNSANYCQPCLLWENSCMSHDKKEVRTTTLKLNLGKCRKNVDGLKLYSFQFISLTSVNTQVYSSWISLCPIWQHCVKMFVKTLISDLKFKYILFHTYKMTSCTSK